MYHLITKDLKLQHSSNNHMYCGTLHPRVTFIYLWKKVLCLFCFVLMRSTKPGCFKLCSWKAFKEEGCISLVSWCLDLQCRKHIEWFICWKFWRNWNVPLVLLERSWWKGFNGIHLVRFGFRLWEIFIFKWFLLLKIQIIYINSVSPSVCLWWGFWGVGEGEANEVAGNRCQSMTGVGPPRFSHWLGV